MEISPELMGLACSFLLILNKVLPACLLARCGYTLRVTSQASYYTNTEKSYYKLLKNFTDHIRRYFNVNANAAEIF
jgi:hypothetical protein